MRLSDAEELAEIAARLCASPGYEQTLANVVTVAEETLRGDYVSLLLRHQGRRVESVAASQPLAERMIDIALDHDESPGLSAIRTGDHVVVHDTVLDDRWPSWAEAAAEAGVRSVFSVCLQDRGRTFGSLNLFATAPEVFDDHACARARAVGMHAGIAITHAQQRRTLRQAVDARHVVGLAQGMLMERHQIDANRAFSILRRYSQNHNVKLRVVARDIVQEKANVPRESPSTVEVSA